jgi:hypothetical protein
MYNADKQGETKNDKNKSESRHGHRALCLLEKHLARGAQKNDDDGW